MRDRFPQIFELSVEEKLRLVEELWDDIADRHADEIPIPEWQLQELARREASYLKDPTAGSSWEEVKERIRARHVNHTDRPA